MSRIPGSPKTGGRVKGTPNKKNQVLEERAKALGVDPFEILLLFAKGDWKALGYDSATITRINGQSIIEEERIPPILRLKAAVEAAQYLLPKKKTVDVNMDLTPEEHMLIGLFRQKLEDHAKQGLSKDHQKNTAPVDSRPLPE